MIVVDASAAFEILLRTPLGTRANLRVADEDVHVPHLIDVEIVSVIRRHLLAKELDAGTAEETLQHLLEWPLIRHPHDVLLPRIWNLRHSVSAYDGCYIALAEVLNAPLLTCDAKLGRSHGHDAKIEVLD
jgi:predicted nucleic acid-binding protein